MSDGRAYGKWNDYGLSGARVVAKFWGHGPQMMGLSKVGLYIAARGGAEDFAKNPLRRSQLLLE